MTFKHILIATDLFPASGHAYAHAAGIAKRTGATVTLLHVDETRAETIRLFSKEPAPWVIKITEQRNARMGEALDTLKALGVEATGLVISGRPREVVPRQAKELGADLLIMVRHDRILQHHGVAFGSTADRVLRMMAVPVLTVPVTHEAEVALEHTPVPEGGWKALTPTRILTTTDFHQTSHRGIRFAAAMADLMDAKLSVAHSVYFPTQLGFSTWVTPMGQIQGDLDRLRTRFLADIEAELDTLGLSGRADAHVEIADRISEGLIHSAEHLNSDLIMVPATGRSGMGRFLLGNNAAALAKVSPIPVMVLPEAWLSGLTDAA